MRDGVKTSVMAQKSVTKSESSLFFASSAQAQASHSNVFLLFEGDAGKRMFQNPHQQGE